ncbi:MAG TPA: hypothetical protein DEQ30_07385 [Porphyromonadaceae bacterium]|nr:hypothetical protein [Porphyromonadaceae bacterium]
MELFLFRYWLYTPVEISKSLRYYQIMNMFNLLLWILAYSLCLIHITLFAIVFLKYKTKTDLYWLIVLSNLFLLTGTIMVLHMFGNADNSSLLLNVLLSVYVTVPLYIYNLFNIKRTYYILIPILVILEALIDNLLILFQHYSLIYVSRSIFYFLLLLPVFCKKKIKPEKGSFLWNIQSMTLKTAIIFIVYMIMLVLFRIFLFSIPYVSSLFWAVFTLTYQIPGLVYCKKRLFQKDALFQKSGMSVLTKRENEVALAICEGYKYEEIAQKLFISLSAVKKHSYNIYRKLSINNNRELIHLFMETKNNSSI